MSEWQIALAAIACGYLAVIFGNLTWDTWRRSSRRHGGSRMSDLGKRRGFRTYEPSSEAHRGTGGQFGEDDKTS
jgi:hypothetical protein